MTTIMEVISGGAFALAAFVLAQPAVGENGASFAALSIGIGTYLALATRRRA